MVAGNFPNHRNPQNYSTFSLLKRSLKYLRPYWKFQLVCLVVAIVLALVSLINPWISKLLIDDVFMSRDLTGLKTVCFLFLGAYLLQAVLSVLQAFLYAKVGGGAVRDLSIDLYDHLQTLSLKYHQDRRIGETIAHFTSDVSAMQILFTSTLVRLITDSLRFLVVLGVMLIINTWLTQIAVICLPLYAYFMKVVSKPVRGASADFQDARATTTADLQENLSGIRETLAFVRKESQSQSMLFSFSTLLRSKVRLAVVNSLTAISGLISALGLVLIVWFGGNEVINNSMQVGVFIAFLGFMGRLFGPVNTFVSVNTSIHTAMGAANRIFKVLDAVPYPIEPAQPVRLDHLNLRIQFDNVSYSYEPGGKAALHDLSLQISSGETIAVVGPSGSGKTTLAMLLLRYADPTSGSIKYGDHDIQELDLDWMRSRIGVVFQDPFLFNMSARDNIAFGNPTASDTDVENAAKAACTLEFIRELPDGFDTIIGERGASLSGGQIQRIAIARAILKQPDLVILDEATSALDMELESLVQTALKRLTSQRTNVIIAHRLSTVRTADRIVVLEQGQIVEEGCYTELIKRRGRFWELQDSLSGDSRV
jgi:subfamily B ATP-binding cassette protein MsbA